MGKIDEEKPDPEAEEAKYLSREESSPGDRILVVALDSSGIKYHDNDIVLPEEAPAEERIKLVIEKPIVKRKEPKERGLF